MNIQSAADGATVEACSRLCMLFAYFVDRRQYDQVIALFTPEADFYRFDDRYHGHSGIRKMLEARPSSLQIRHFCSNTLIDRNEDGEVFGVTYFQAFRVHGSSQPPFQCDRPDICGEFHDRFELGDARWRIAERRVISVFESQIPA